MSALRPLFLQHIAQTSDSPASVEPERALGIYIYNTEGKRYTDLNSGYSVSVLGHCHPRVVQAVQHQAETYMHTTVYGEHIQAPQVRLAKKLSELLDPSLDCVYFVNSGAEAVEGAMKLARRYTSRYEIIACRNAYHGSTQGADSLRSDLDYTSAFMPLLPGIRHIDFSSFDDLSFITKETAAVVIEPVQAESGVQLPSIGYLKALRQRCDETGALLILDEIQTGFARTGCMFAHQVYGVIPDILLLAKSLGGGMPLGAFISKKKLMRSFTYRPVLGHLTTFGGHPVSCAAALATIDVLLEEKLVDTVEEKAYRFLDKLQHPAIVEVRNAGLMMAVELQAGFPVGDFLMRALENGLITDWFLFNHSAFRIAPPLIITFEEIDMVCEVILSTLDFFM